VTRTPHLFAGYPPTRVWGCPTTAMWTYRLGPTRAKTLMFTGDVLTGSRAAEWGLAHSAVSGGPEALETVVHALASRIASVPKSHLAMHKMVVNSVVERCVTHTGTLEVVPNPGRGSCGWGMRAPSISLSECAVAGAAWTPPSSWPPCLTALPGTTQRVGVCIGVCVASLGWRTSPLPGCGLLPGVHLCFQGCGSDGTPRPKGSKPLWSGGTLEGVRVEHALRPHTGPPHLVPCPHQPPRCQHNTHTPPPPPIES
jgi:hypothetical protein